MLNRALAAAFGVFLSIPSQLASAETSWYKVASIDIEHPDQCDFIVTASPYRYNVAEIPLALLPENSPHRNILFDARLEFGFLGLNPTAQYQLRASFLSDGGGRAARIEAGDVTLEANLALPDQQMLDRTWTLPPNTFASGKLSVCCLNVSGPNAVISSLEVWSSDPTPLAAPTSLAQAVAQIAVPLPRLTARPASVAGIASPTLSLSGDWKFCPLAPEHPGMVTGSDLRGWKSIQVPAEWVMQGYHVETNHFACYAREFDVPPDWAGNRLKLRFDAVHSECRIWLNGTEVGGHEGEFDAFEFDVTEAAKPGRNLLTVAVKSESVSDALDTATQYAGHQLGGITRKVTLFAVPQINVAALALTTKFDPEFKNATLNYHLEIANQLARIFQATVRFELVKPDGKSVEMTAENRGFNLPLPAGETTSRDGVIPVTSPRQWDTEHPNLYTLRVQIGTDKTTEELAQRFGFRQIDLRGNQVFVNNHAIKLHGVCRHETHPLLGRSLTSEFWRKDAEIFRAANVNYIRTSHYPPAEEFLDACDELGLFVECESALCWVQFSANPIWSKWIYRDPKFFPYLMRANLENVVFNRNHPSIIIWSLANESHWSPLFAEVNQRVKHLDPSRPTSFHEPGWGGAADIANGHYPGTNGPAACDGNARPALFGEYCHVETYNHREHFTDPGVRDQWGPRFAEMYDQMYCHTGCLGGAIWSGIDDAFDLPDGQVEGYGFWGIIDGWRREKPEAFHVRKAYSPVRVTTRELSPDEDSCKIQVENRYNFANLNEVAINWSLGAETGLAAADIPPRSAGEFAVNPKHKPAAGQILHLAFTDPRGFICDSVDLPIGRSPAPARQDQSLESAGLQVETNSTAIRIQGAQFTCEIDLRSGQLRDALVGGERVLISGPSLMILPFEDGPCQPQDLTRFGPLNETCHDWRSKSVAVASQPDGSVLVNVEGQYAEARGSYSMCWQPDGRLDVKYDFIATQAILPRQAGLVFWLAKDCDTLRWQRQAEWSCYPADHIGRPVGQARANPNSNTNIVHLAAAPEHSWSADSTALGTADFRSSKTHILSASLRAPNGCGLALNSDGSQTTRAFVAGDCIGWLIAAINAGGGDSFFAPHFGPDQHPLPKGSHLADTIHLQLFNHP